MSTGKESSRDVSAPTGDVERPTSRPEVQQVQGSENESHTDVSMGIGEQGKDAEGLEFKKPNLPKSRPMIGKQFSKNSEITVNLAETEDETDAAKEEIDSSRKETTRQPRTEEPPLSYSEPQWAAPIGDNYAVEVLKSGVILETVPLRGKSFFVIGRLPSCDLCLAHPTISRHHAVLQYRQHSDDANPKGLYVYDLGSTHGTFWNGSRIKSNVYVKLRGGHMLKFGCSQRKYILTTPVEDQEEESAFTVTELKERRQLEIHRWLLQQQEEKNMPEREERDGINWGMAEDADEASDLQENPYAITGDESLFLDDPKKTLRGWFEREGYDLQYQTEEKGVGQFLCWLDLPIESITGRSVRAEALVKGKKKEAVVQCALEACRILDKYGLLRQASHEARKRKTRNWQEEDYYDSDDDSFFDRTGSIERKREQRMRLAGKLEDRVETYDSLLHKYEQVATRIASLRHTIENSGKTEEEANQTEEDDALVAYMSRLSSSTLSRSDLAKMKMEIQSLQKEREMLTKLLDLARPANLPPLAQSQATTSATDTNPQQCLPKKQGSSKRRCAPTLEGVAFEDQTESMNANREDGATLPKNDAQRQEQEQKEDEKKVKMKLEENPSDAEVATKKSKYPPKKIAAESRGAANRSKFEDDNKVQPSKESHNKTQETCDQDVCTENYSMWVPPENQLGDGRTSLNEKFGY